MAGEPPIPYIFSGQKILKPDGTPHDWFWQGWNAMVDRLGGETYNESFGVINGKIQAAQSAADNAQSTANTANTAAATAQTSANTANTAAGQVASGLAQEIPARISGDAANAGTGDGSGTSDARPFSGVNVPDATWVNAVTLFVTPTGAGTYSLAFLPDSLLNSPTVTGGGGTTFNGNWRVVEYRISDGDTTTLATGTFTATESTISWEGGSQEVTNVAFSGLPTSESSNYTSAVEIRLDLQRASGSEAVAGLSGNASVSWA